MYHAPRHFIPQEFFTKATCDAYKQSNGSISAKIWRLMDSRVTWTCDALRDYFGTMIMNDYQWGGRNQYRGYRPPLELLNKAELKRSNTFKSKLSSFTSQHCFGRASDSKFKKVTAEEVREDVKKNPTARRYRFITCIEEGVTWFHFDVRFWNVSKSGILYFEP